jgi:hypothetical protein
MLRRVLKPKVVGDNETRVDLALFNPSQQRVRFHEGLKSPSFPQASDAPQLSTRGNHPQWARIQ